MGKVRERAGRFAVVFILVFVLSFAFLAWMGAIPTASTAEGERVQEDTQVVSVEGEEPIRIVASSIRLDERIENPVSRDPGVLDRALLKGAVRYPGSARLGERGNTVLFGHSSYLSVVNNEAYRAFNDIQKLKVDDTVSLFSKGREYRYRVTSVRFANAEEGVIDLTLGKPRLTLVTCDSFRTKSDRFVIEAELVGSYPSA